MGFNVYGRDVAAQNTTPTFTASCLQSLARTLCGIYLGSTNQDKPFPLP